MIISAEVYFNTLLLILKSKVKNAFLTFLDHTSGHTVHLFENVCQKPHQSLSFFIHVKQNLPNDFVQDT